MEEEEEEEAGTEPVVVAAGKRRRAAGELCCNLSRVCRLLAACSPSYAASACPCSIPSLCVACAPPKPPPRRRPRRRRRLAPPPSSSAPTLSATLGGYFKPDATDEASLASALIDKLSYTHTSSPRKLQWHALPLASARSLVQAIAIAHERSSNLEDIDVSDDADPLLDTQRRDLAAQAAHLRESRRGEARRSLRRVRRVLGWPPPASPRRDGRNGRRLALLTRRRALPPRGATSLFSPTPVQALSFTAGGASVRALLYEALGVRRLYDADIFERFLLPTFSAAPPAMQSRQRAHLLSNWQSLRQHDGFATTLRETPFVPVGGRLLGARDVLDPRVDVLSYIFGGEAVFPEAECGDRRCRCHCRSLSTGASTRRGAYPPSKPPPPPLL